MILLNVVAIVEAFNKETAKTFALTYCSSLVMALFEQCTLGSINVVATL